MRNHKKYTELNDISLQKRVRGSIMREEGRRVIKTWRNKGVIPVLWGFLRAEEASHSLAAQDGLLQDLSTALVKHSLQGHLVDALLQFTDYLPSWRWGAHQGVGQKPCCSRTADVFLETWMEWGVSAWPRQVRFLSLCDFLAGGLRHSAHSAFMLIQ